MTTPKRHHFLPQFLLRGFSRDDYVALFDRKRNKYRVQHVKDTAVIGHYYSAEDAEGNKDVRIEQMLGDIETATAPVIRKLDNGERLTDEDRQALAMFVGYLYARVPEFEAMINQVHSSGIKLMMRTMYPNEKLAHERYGEGLERFGLTAKGMVDFVNRDKFDITIHRNESLRTMLYLATTFSDMFLNMNWAVAHPQSDKQAFVLTDSPVAVYPPKGYKPGWYGVGMAMKGVSKTVPLSQRTCLIIGDLAESPRTWEIEITREMVRDTNMGSVIRCHNYVIGRDEALIRNLVEATKVNKTAWKSKIRIG